MMSQVFWRNQALTDLDHCIDALMFPEPANRPSLTYEDAIDYKNDIVTFALSLRNRIRHIACVYEIHKQYGSKVARYDRNKNTQYYIIYNVDTEGNIYVERIMTNHITIS
ncbi:MAG: hypothetical protein LBU22_12710 [Dysgonamonadaceae bacterium]|jgi:hypothetical protein|nr:hypothetical protein [Dysgonamonadaceae bacterium]